MAIPNKLVLKGLLDAIELEYSYIQRYRVTPEDFIAGKEKPGWYIRLVVPEVLPLAPGELYRTITQSVEFLTHTELVIGKPRRYGSRKNETCKGLIDNTSYVVGCKNYSKIKGLTSAYTSKMFLDDLARSGQCYIHNTRVSTFFKTVLALAVKDTYRNKLIAICNGLSWDTLVSPFVVKPTYGLPSYVYDYLTRPMPVQQPSSFVLVTF